MYLPLPALTFLFREIKYSLKGIQGTSLAVQWLGLWASNAGGVGSIPGWRTTIPHAAWSGQKSKKMKRNLVCCVLHVAKGGDT